MAKKSTSYFLIGEAREKLISLRTPPTLRQVLQNFVFHHLEQGEPIKKAASTVIQNTMVIWDQLEIKTKRIDKCEDALKKEYDLWHKLSRSEHSQSDFQKTGRANLINRLDKPFDMSITETATQSTGELMDTSVEEQEQEQETILDVVMHQEENEPSSSGQSSSGVKKRSSAMEAEDKMKALFEGTSNIDPTEYVQDEPKSQKQDEDDDYVERKRRKVPLTRFIDRDLVAKLDELGLSDYQAAQAIMIVAQALGHPLGDTVISRSTIQRYRTENRHKIAEEIKENFSVSVYYYCFLSENQL